MKLKHEVFRELCSLNGDKVDEWRNLDRTPRKKGREVVSVYKVSASKGTGLFVGIWRIKFLTRAVEPSRQKLKEMALRTSREGGRSSPNMNDDEQESNDEQESERDGIDQKDGTEEENSMFFIDAGIEVEHLR